MVGHRLNEVSRGEALLQYYSGEAKREDLGLREWIDPILESSGNLVLVFETAYGSHFVTSSDDELVAIYAGEHGPENRPANVDTATIEQLVREASSISISPLEETPFSDIAIRDLL